MQPLLVTHLIRTTASQTLRVASTDGLSMLLSTLLEEEKAKASGEGGGGGGGDNAAAMAQAAVLRWEASWAPAVVDALCSPDQQCRAGVAAYSLPAILKVCNCLPSTVGFPQLTLPASS